MKKYNSPQQNNKFPFHGFTLLELLIVMTIISVLIALLLPAINGARRSARDTQVRTEIGQIETALSAFKAKYGQYPPSSIKLYVGVANWNTDPESKAVIRSFWPEFDFATLVADLPWPDTGAVGTPLYGAECLVFFLGGVNDAPASFNLIGFSKDPSNPFSRAGTNRDRPLIEFDASRLAFNPNLTYLDPLNGQTNPYIYMSSDDGRGYDATDFNGAMTEVYLQNGTKAWKNESYQIISPGQDGAYGYGGVFNTKQADTALIINGDINGDSVPDGIDRSAERDNITNFHSSRLAP